MDPHVFPYRNSMFRARMNISNTCKIICNNKYVLTDNRLSHINNTFDQDKKKKKNQFVLIGIVLTSVYNIQIITTTITVK